MTKDTFQVGDLVNVLNACRLSAGVEEVRHTGRIRGISYCSPTNIWLTRGEPIYWIEGVPCGRSANVLRRAE